MPAGKPLTIKEFAGLDLRRVNSSSDPKSQRVLKNAYVTNGKGIRNRPGTVAIAQAHPSSKGLFAANGLLYSVAPAGYPAIAQTASPDLRYLFIGDGGGYDIDHITALSGSEIIGTTPIGQGIPYVSILNKKGIYEHHYGDIEPASLTDIPNTLVGLPFAPSAGLLKLASRLWAPSDTSGVVHFSSILQGPRDWEEPADAGFIPVSKNTPGDRVIQGLGYIRDRMIVAFEDSLQMWAVDESPDNITLVEILNGPGTKYERALENVLGDSFYFSNGGFRSLITSTIEGQREESDIGVKIQEITNLLPTDPEPVSVWSQTRGQYICSFGNTLLVFTYIPSEKTFGWSEWDMPYSVTDLVESKGVLYCRDTNGVVRKFDDDLTSDDAAEFTWRFQTQFIGQDEKARLWNFTDVGFSMIGEASVYLYPDFRNPDARIFMGKINDSSTPFERMYLSTVAPSVALALEGTGHLQLDSLAIRLEELAV